ncbi:hypothetical protein ACIPLA_27810, partial [Pseudomonas sp. NPDC086112]|uniref:hypothetical protein n=1 Tax=Pseudomonas sp. NPDC086112 TaxID=3364430 RepID=UPI00380E4D3F
MKPLLLACFHLTGSPLGNIRIPPEKASSQQLADPPNLPGNVLQKGAKRGLIYFLYISFKINQSLRNPRFFLQKIKKLGIEETCMGRQLVLHHTE